MEGVVDHTAIPFLDEVQGFLPIDAVDKEDIATYIRNIVDLVALNYKYEQYQFAYLGLHLLYMTYIYCTVWKISKVNEARYTDMVVFAKPYHNKKLDFCNIESVFEYSYVPERELPKIFQLIDLDKAQIGIIGGLVDDRNDMAHASGRFKILTEDSFTIGANAIYTSIKNIHGCMDKQIRLWYQDVLVKYCNEEFEGYSEVNDFIAEQMIQSFYLSVNELLICNTMSIKEIIKGAPDIEDRLIVFKSKLNSYCENAGYVQV